MSGGLEQLSTSAGKLVSQLRKTFNTVSTGYKKFKDMDESIRGSGTSFSDYIRWTSKSEDATEAFGLATAYTKLRVVALNMALSAGIGLVVSYFSKKIVEAAQRVDKLAESSKEAADAATSTTSSLSELVDEYEKLGKKSDWDTDDMERAQKIQDEILKLAKEQGTLNEDHASKIDLQNGKYEEQLGLLQDITAEQLEASRYELTQNKDAQDDKLVNTAKKNNRTHYITVWSAPEMDMGDQIKNAGIDVFNKFGGYGPDDLNDADSVVDYYNEVGKALKYVIDNTTEAERAAGGTYHSLYQFLLDEQSALRDDVNSYNNSTDAINNNTNARRKLQAVDFWSDGKSNGMDVSFTFDKVNSAVQALEDTIDGFDASKLNELLLGTNEGLSDEQAQALANLRKALTDMDFSADTNGVNAFIQALVQVGIVAQSSANGVDALAAGAQKMEDISSKMDEIQSAYKASTSAMEEYNQYGYMSLDSLQSLLTMNTEYLNCLELVNGKLQINKQSYAELLAAEYAEAAATILSNAQHEVANLTADDTAESTDNLKEKTKAEKTALENLLPALKNATAATATYSAAQEFANEVEKAGERGVDPAKLEEITNRTNTQLSLLYTNMNAALRGGQKLTNQLNGFPTNKASKNNKSTAKSVTDIASAFDTLTKAMKEYNQYGYICADTMKSLIGVDDKFTACLTEQNGKLELNTAKFRTFVKAQLEEANAANDGGKSADEMKKILDWLNSSVDSETISFEQLTDAIKGYGTAMDEAKEKTDAIKSAFSGLSDVLKTLSESQFGIPDLDATEKQIEAIQQLVPYAPELISAAIDENGNINLDTDKFKKALINALKEQARVAKETGGAGAKAMAQAYTNAADSIEKNLISVGDYINGLGTDLSNANTVLDEYQNTWTTLMDAMKEQNANGQLTQDTQQKLMELKPEFRALLTTDENGNATVNVRELRNLYQAQLEKLAKEFKGKPIGIQAEAMIKDIREPTPEEYEELAKKTVKYQLALAKYTKRIAEIESNGNLSEDEYLQQKAEADAELNQALQDSLNDVKETDADVTAKLKKHWEGVQSIIDEFKSALSDIKDLLSSFLSLLSTWNDNSSNDLKIWGDVMGDIIDKRIEELNKQKEALQDANDEEERAITLAKLKAELEKAQGQRTVRKLTSNGYEWVADESAVKEARDNLNDQQREWRKEDAEKAIDDQIEKYNEFKDKLSEIMDDIGKSWKDYQKELKYTAQIQDMTLADMEGSLDGYHNKIIASIKNSGSISSIQDVISKIESLIGTLEKLNNVYSWVQSGFTSYTDQGFGGLLNTISKLFGKNGAANSVIETGTETATNIVTGGISSVVKAAKKGANSTAGLFQNTWTSIATGAKNLFNGTGSGSLITTISGGLSKLGTTITSGLGSIVKGVGSFLGIGGTAAGGSTAVAAGGTAAATGLSSIPIVGTILAAIGLGTAGAVNNVKNIKSIWSGDDSTGTKIGKSVFTLGSSIFGLPLLIPSLIHDAIARKNSEKNGTSYKSLGEKIYDLPIWFWNWGKNKRASGDKSVRRSGPYNVDELGPELIVRQPQSGRYTYLETGDGVVPADITSKLFEMGGNPDGWFSEQLSRNMHATDSIQTRNTSGASFSVGDIYIQNPVGNVDTLAKNIVRELPNKLRQEQSRR